MYSKGSQLLGIIIQSIDSQGNLFLLSVMALSTLSTETPQMCSCANLARIKELNYVHWQLRPPWVQCFSLLAHMLSVSHAICGIFKWCEHIWILKCDTDWSASKMSRCKDFHRSLYTCLNYLIYYFYTYTLNIKVTQ